MSKAKPAKKKHGSDRRHVRTLAICLEPAVLGQLEALGRVLSEKAHVPLSRSRVVALAVQSTALSLGIKAEEGGGPPA
jgi:hypothetical protein